MNFLSARMPFLVFFFLTGFGSGSMPLDLINLIGGSSTTRQPSASTSAACHRWLQRSR
jgi:hypothetical protein